MALFSYRVLFLLSAFLYSASTTRFLPSVIWDYVNPLLCSPYNWLVVPQIDFHDALEFVCPTTKLVVKQVNFKTRNGESMNLNLFRRQWPGTVHDLQQSIRDGSIHSFCNVSHPDSVKLFTCRDGKYSSFPVKFTDFVFENERIKYDKYEKQKTYVFYNNGDGSKSSLKSKATKCSMLFAVYTASEKRLKFDMTYGKQVLQSQCDTSMKPTVATTLATTVTTQEPTTSSLPSTINSTPTKSTTAPQESTTTPPPPTKSTTIPSATAPTNDATFLGNKFETSSSSNTRKPTDSDHFEGEECEENWLSVPVLITVIVAACILGIVCTVVFYQLVLRKPGQKDGYNNVTFSGREVEIATPEGTISERSKV